MKRSFYIYTTGADGRTYAQGSQVFYIGLSGSNGQPIPAPIFTVVRGMTINGGTVVKISGAGVSTVENSTSATDQHLGVAVSNSAALSNQTQIALAYGGAQCLGRAGTNITAGQYLTSDSAGNLVPATSGQYAIATATESISWVVNFANRFKIQTINLYLVP